MKALKIMSILMVCVFFSCILVSSSSLEMFLEVENPDGSISIFYLDDFDRVYELRVGQKKLFSFQIFSNLFAVFFPTTVNVGDSVTITEDLASSTAPSYWEIRVVKPDGSTKSFGNIAGSAQKVSTNRWEVSLTFNPSMVGQYRVESRINPSHSFDRWGSRLNVLEAQQNCYYPGFVLYSENDVQKVSHNVNTCPSQYPVLYYTVCKRSTHVIQGTDLARLEDTVIHTCVLKSGEENGNGDNGLQNGNGDNGYIPPPHFEDDRTILDVFAPFAFIPFFDDEPLDGFFTVILAVVLVLFLVKNGGKKKK